MFSYNNYSETHTSTMCNYSYGEDDIFVLLNSLYKQLLELKYNTNTFYRMSIFFKSVNRL